MSEVEGEPSQSQSAVDTAIRIIKSYQDKEMLSQEWIDEHKREYDEMEETIELLQALNVKSTKVQNGRLVGGYVDKENETNKAIDRAVGVLKLIEKWGLADLSLDELDRWRDRGRWHVDYVANERWKEEPLEVFVLMKEYIESKEVVLDGVFSSMEKLNKHIQSSDESGDYVEHGITKVEVR